MTASTQAVSFSKDHPLVVRVVENRALNGAGSAKDTRHFVVSVAGSGLRLEAGDSLGVYPVNRPPEVDEILRCLGATGQELVTLPRVVLPLSLREALYCQLALAGPTRKALEAFAARATAPAECERLARLLAPEAAEETKAWLAEREFVDLLHDFPSARFSPQDFVALLRRLTPRLYSIASSPKAFPDEVHLTVAVVKYRTNARDRFGVCSTFLADRVQPGETPVSVFPVESHFRLPADPGRDIIMVGPGTGVAPFRAFLQEREVTAASGRNWLFFGEQRRATDYLYQEEFEAWQRRGLLTRLDLAFSRDQAERIYVQHRMREQAAELWRWLDGGAHLYVCGDAKRMAKDVDAALHEIVAGQGGLSSAAAAEFVKQLKKDGRYQRDVY